ncbi:MAG: 2-hydroxyglutaryl-CoA dehydratase [Clostridiales bacterium]|nr:2-hydroxyglutaryl-CoA dehydratase [Clostridiales bacterium]
MRIGLDIGSTTIKAVVLDKNDQIVFHHYERHRSQISRLAVALLQTIRTHFPGERFTLGISGSAGMGLAEELGIDFIQEVYATRVALRKMAPDADVAIELGGEDAKILFLTGAGGLEVRMNGTCAGGTGAFIDQMATLMDVPVEQLEPLSKAHQCSYPIASRCGVFAKSDIQPLLNQGAKKEDVARSIFEAVAGQTIAGLAQGRKIQGNVVYLGGPLTFFSQLRDCFDSALGLTGFHPENALYSVAFGAAVQADTEADIDALIPLIENRSGHSRYVSCPPLFNSEAEYEAFRARHAQSRVDTVSAPEYSGKVYIGVDSGSTTIKAVVIDEQLRILKKAYLPNKGNPLPAVRQFLTEFYREFPNAKVGGAGATGYGEDLVRTAFRLDCGVVETVAHFIAAKQLQPQVDFIIDIGGQDIKCFRIRDGAIDDIFLNEACSSGCGSFIQTFAATWGLPVDEFARKGLLAGHPVDLGSRCTVFMNSSVKQAQKDGATLEDISAGLSISIVKNALYKVIRTANAAELGDHIVVQGGTFLNDAVLRAFEREIGKDVIRPNIAGLMGAYGVAVYSAQRSARKNIENSTLLSPAELEAFTQKNTNTRCKGCQNHCQLTIIQFEGGRRFISGNRCERMVGSGKTPLPNMYAEKREMLRAFPAGENRRGRIGIPMGLNLYELFPFWHALFTHLGFEVVQSPESDHALYAKGQQTIPSDTACYPAKLLHGHIEWLLDQGVDAIFYPCLSYNLDEHRGDNHYNCPVVAYYPEVIRLNVPRISETKFICDYLGIHRPKDFERKFQKVLKKYFPGIPAGEVRAAVRHAYRAYEEHMANVRARGEKLMAMARERNLPVIILCGRPYHVDPEISHGIDQQIAQLGAVVVTEDAVNMKVQKFHVNVLNQWTYHSRLYSAAQFVSECGDPNVNLVQLVSFGCGVDAITTDEVRRILSDGKRLYTQLKIDEISNPGAVRIRLRSLFAALNQEESHAKQG